MCKTIQERKIDIVFVSEQYKRPETQMWYEDVSRKAGIYIVNPILQRNVTKYKTSGKYFVWVEISGVRYYSCYFSPNHKIEEFQKELEDLETDLRSCDKEVIITGDFNSKSPVWFERRLDKRGEMTSELISRKRLVVINVGRRHTCTDGSGSIIDLTLASAAVSRLMKGWKVLNDYSMSDHNYIMCTVEQDMPQKVARKKRWNLKKFNRVKFCEKLEEERLMKELSLSWIRQSQSADGMAKNAEKIIALACDASMPKTGEPRFRQPVYWWRDEIEEARKECVKAWRRSTRSRGNPELRNQHTLAKKKLKREIDRSIRDHWKELVDEVESDPWGKAYKIVRKKLKIRQDIPELNDPAFVEQVIRDLFPPQVTENRERQDDFEFPEDMLFTLEELQSEAKQLKNNKVAGPDGIPNEVLKVVVETCPKVLLDVFNACLRQAVFPKQWKRQNLTLLKKGDKPPDQTSSYRPICLLDTMGKLFEGLILRRLRRCLESKYSDRQYGFRKGRSTVDAIIAVVKAVSRGKAGNKKRKGFCAAVALDIRNAFNSARWIDFIMSLVRKDVPEYLIRIIEDYLSDRKVFYENITADMTGGAAQGSRMGPDLWNSSYDDFLNLPLPDGCTIFGFADDALFLVWDDDERLLELKVNTGLFLIKRWMDSRGLKLALHKTEAVLMTDRRVFRKPVIRLSNEIIEWKKQLRYLGVELDHKLSFGPHIMRITQRALETTTQLSRIMPNTRGPSEWKRKVVCSSAYSQLLYAAPVWAEALEKKTLLQKVLSVQRIMAMRVVSAYRTVSTAAILVLAGTPPADLLATERRDSYVLLSELEPAERTLTVRNGISKIVRDRLENKWQQRWTNEDTGRWTYVLIPELRRWIRREHGQVNYYMTQALSGHGSFKAYLKRFKISQQSTCDFCACDYDDAEHTLFHCTEWKSSREAAEMKIGEKLTKDNMVNKMLESRQNWNDISTFVSAVMKRKELDQRRRQRG